MLVENIWLRHIIVICLIQAVEKYLSSKNEVDYVDERKGKISRYYV
jgi:hypothetical protein